MDDKDKEDLQTFRLQNVFDLRYAKKEEVFLIRTIVFGAVGLILTSVMGAIMAFVLNKPTSTPTQATTQTTP
jgi:hypothetical protein